MEFDYTDSQFTRSQAVGSVYYNENDKKALVHLKESGTCYIYDNVDREGYKALVSADSVGGHYNKVFKPAYGPSVGQERGLEVFPHRVDIKNPEIPSNNRRDPGLVQNQFALSSGNASGPHIQFNGDGSGRVGQVVWDDQRAGAYDTVLEPVEEKATKEYSLGNIDLSPAVDANTTVSNTANTTKEFSLDTPEVEEEAFDTDANLWNYAVHFTIDGVDGKKVKTLTAYSPEEAIAEVEELAGDLGVEIAIYKVVITFE